jgi:hypothetical protein
VTKDEWKSLRKVEAKLSDLELKKLSEFAGKSTPQGIIREVWCRFTDKRLWELIGDHECATEKITRKNRLLVRLPRDLEQWIFDHSQALKVTKGAILHAMVCGMLHVPIPKKIWTRLQNIPLTPTTGP